MTVFFPGQTDISVALSHDHAMKATEIPIRRLTTHIKHEREKGALVTTATVMGRFHVDPNHEPSRELIDSLVNL